MKETLFYEIYQVLDFVYYTCWSHFNLKIFFEIIPFYFLYYETIVEYYSNQIFIYC